MAPMISNQPDNIDLTSNLNLPVHNDMGLSEHNQNTATSTSDIDGSSDIGTHSNFTNLQAGPDSIYDNLTEANSAPAPTNSENDIDSDASDVDSSPDLGNEGTFANAQGTTLDSSYFTIQEESVISSYGGVTGGVFVTGSIPYMAGYVRTGDGFYQAIFWNPTDDVYEISRVEFSYVGSNWLSGITQGSGLSSPTSGWGNNATAAYWVDASTITVQPHTAQSFYVKGAVAKLNLAPFSIDIRITANSSIYAESYSSGIDRRDMPIAQLWLGSSLPPSQIHSVPTSTTTRVYVSLEEDGNSVAIPTGTLTIDVPTGFTSITDVGGINWGTATIDGYQITVSSTATVLGSHITYAFDITSPSTPGLYKLDLAFNGGSDASPIGNFTIHVTGVPQTVEKVNVEYQWSTATFSDTYEEVCINVGSLTGSENLIVNYWDGFSWNSLGSITNIGWSNFTATGLTSSIYTIQFVGSSETSDSLKDTWNIDLITLHTWSTQTYNYKLDLEVQWASANYTQDFEELCIYTGSLDAESIRIDVWNGGGWTNIALDLTGSDWNNFTVSTWLTSSTFTIRFRGDFEVGDTIQSSWEIDVCLLHTWDNNVPQTTPTPTISNLDDIAFLYANYKQYELTAEVSDADGFAEIDYFELTLTSDNRSIEYWTIRYDEDTGNFTEQFDPSNYITLDTDSSSAIKSGNNISATFFITINWNHPDAINTDLKSIVYDANPSSSSEYFEVNWNVETRLEIQDEPTLDDGVGTGNRGDFDQSITASGVVTYLNSSLHPPASEIDIWIQSSEYGTHIGPWEATSYTDVNGTFTATVYADNAVGIDTYTFKAVKQGTGVTGTNLFDSSETAQYIADRVQVQSYSADDSRINVNSTATLHVVLYYEFDSSFVTDGNVSINGKFAIYSGFNGVWTFTDEKSTAQLVTYNTLVYSGGTYGITGENQNGKSIGQIWDYVRVVSYSAIDSRVDVSSSVIIDVTLVFQYDGAPVTNGSVFVNGLSASHLGSGVWRFTDSKGAVQIFTYDTVTVSANNYGITTVDQNSQFQDVIWDRILVVGYSVSDDRVNVGTSVYINVTIVYEYNSTPVVDGSVTVNLVAASHIENGIWRISVSKSSVQNVTYSSVACSANSFGITVVNTNSQSQEIIWDRVIVISYSASDDRIGLNELVDVNVTLRYQYDNTPVTMGTVAINSISAIHLENGIWSISVSNSSVQAITFDTVACSGNNYGITVVNQNSKSITVIWDQIVVMSYTVLDNRVNLNDLVSIDVLLEYEYDGSDITNATVTINALSAAHVSGGIWRITVSQSSVLNVTYDTVTCSDNTYEISSISQNGQSTSVVWDQIVVRSYSVSDDRANLGSSVDISFIIEYEYDDSAVTDGTVTLNGYNAAFSVGAWHISQSRGTVQSVTYNNVQCSNNLHGITGVNQNTQSATVIWDQIVVRSYAVLDNRVNLDALVYINVTLEYEYDDSDVTDGSVTINTISATHQGNGVWQISQTRSTVQGVTYNTVACSGNTYVITNVNQAGLSQLVIWDQITVRGYEISDTRDNVGEPVTITVELEYEYDDSDVIDGSVSINSLSFTYTGSLGKWSAARTWGSVRNETFDTVIASSNAHGISTVNQDGQSQTAIWDRIQVLTTTVDDSRISTGSSCQIRVTLVLEYDSTPLGSGDNVILNGASMTWNSGALRFELSRLRSTVGLWTFFVNSSLETTYGIYALNLNSQEVGVIWDRIRIKTTTVDDGRVNLGSSVELRVTAELEYDNHSLTSGDTIIMDGVSMSWDGGNTRFILSRTRSIVGLYSFQVGSAAEATYGISSINLNGKSQSVIWDRLNIIIAADLDTVENDVQVNFTMTVTYEYDSTVCTTFNIVVYRNDTYWNTFTNLNISDFVDTNSATVYQYNATFVNSESTYGITVFSASNETVSWGSGITAPINSVAPKLTNADDISFMYAKLRFYLITSSVSDANGYEDIAYVYLSLWDNTRSTEIWRIRYNASSNIFNITLGNEYIELGLCSFSKGGFTINITWSIKIDWDHQDLTNVDVKQYVIDSTSEFDENWYEVDWDVETRLNYSLLPSLSDDRGDLDTSNLECSGIVVYYGSSLHPLANETDIWVSHDETGTWSGEIDEFGAFAITNIGSSNEVRLNNYTIKIVVQGDGYTGLDQYYTSSVIVYFITDRIEFYLSGVDSARVNIDENGVVWWSARYDYDNISISSGLIAELNISKGLSWDSGLSRWYYNETLSVLGRIGYQIYSASESEYGLTGWIQTASNVSVIWDKIVVRSYQASTMRTNVSDIVEIDVLLEYEFDDSWVTDATIEINSSMAVYQGEGFWRILVSRSSVISETFSLVVCSISANNITVVDQNSQSISIIWDRILVESYFASDSRVAIGDSVTINITLTYEYDGTPVTNGIVTINGFDASSLGSGIWQINQSRISTQVVTYDLVVCSGNSYGITVVNQNSLSQEIIWDQVIVQYYTVLDNRVNVGGTATIDVVLHYWYDDLPVTDGSVTINGISAAHLANGIWRITDSKSSVQSVTYDDVICSGNAHGIDSVDPNGQSTSVIFDEVAVRGYSVSDNRVSIGTTVTINVTLEYAFDNASVVNGIVLIQSVSATHVGNGIWKITMMKSSVQLVSFNTIVCSGNTYGISSVNQNGISEDVIWDKVVVRSYSVSDSRVNINDFVNITVLLQFEYDDTPVTNGTVTINGASATPMGAGIWRITDSKSTVQIVTYNMVTCTGNDYQINTIDQNSQSKSVIWDRVIVALYQVLDSRIDVGYSVNVDVSLQFEFDGTDVTSGSVQINSIDASYEGGNIWRISVSEFDVGAVTYNTVTCSGNNYGINTVNQNGQSITVIWDRIIVRSYSVSDDRDNVGSVITVYITLQYEYDNTNVTMGNVIVNSIPFTYTGSDGTWFVNRSQNTVTSETYNSAEVSNNNYGITGVNQDGKSTTIIWDRIKILTTTADYTRLDTGIAAMIMVTAELEYDHHPLGTGDMLELDDNNMTWHGGNSWFYLDVTQSSIGLWTYFVNNTGASEATFGITAIIINSQSIDVIWDELSIIITPSDTSVYDYVTVSFSLDVLSSFDGTPCTSYSIVISRNGTNWITVTNSNVSLFADVNNATIYNYSVSSIIFDGTFGLTVFTPNTVEVSWITPANFAPINNGAPILLDPDDIDNIYARLRMYHILSSVFDYDGYTDIDYIELSLWDNNREIEVWRVRYTVANNSFKVISGDSFIYLSPSSLYLPGINRLNVTWSIKIDWDHMHMVDADVKQEVFDSIGESAEDWYEVNWDIETRLDYTSGGLPTLSYHHGNIGTDDLDALGNVIYYGSSSLLSPLANETDVWVIHDYEGSWSGDIDSSGLLSVSGIGSSSLVRLNTYTFKIVVAGQGPAGTDLYYSTSRIDTFITDRIEFYQSGVVDSRININSQCDVWWKARYDYNNSDIQSGLEAYLNGAYLLTWDAANSRWHYRHSRASASLMLFKISGASETVYSISSWIDGTTNQTVIWDSLRIIINDPIDRRINVGDNATGITVYAVYSYDLTRFDGTVLLNNTVFRYSAVQRQYYTVSSVFGDSYGITAIVLNDMTWCIWDQVEVVFLNSDVIYLDLNEYARVQILLQYDFDDAPITAGIFSLKYQDLTHIADGIWEVNVTRISYNSIAFDALTTSNATVFGINEYDFYGNNLTVYWDRLEFYQSSSPDTRINVGSNGFTIWAVRLQYAHITISSGLIARTIDGSSLIYVDGAWRSTHTSDVVGDITFSIQSASFDGIDYFVSSTNDITIIWDRIEVQTMSATNPNPEIETYIQIRATLAYEYDNTPVTDGSVSLWDQDNQIAMVYNATGGFWYANLTKVEVGNYTFYIQAVSGNQYGISSMNAAGISVTVEFIPAILPRLTPMMIAGISGGFGILLLISAVLVRRRYRLSVPEEIRQIDRALKAMEAGEPVEGLVVRSAQEILYIELEPGLLELGLTVEQLVGDITPQGPEDSWTVDPDADLKDIMDEFKLPGYKQELDEGEIDISILSDEESEKAWSEMLKEVRRIESTQGRKIPLTKEDWIERIPSEVKNVFFEEELLELGIEELEHLTQLTPSELDEIMSSISSTEDMYASFEPESSAAAISSALCDRMESQSSIELDENEKKERLFELLPPFVKEFFSNTWLEKLSCEELQELLIIPEDELKSVIESIADSRSTTPRIDGDIQSSIEESDESIVEETDRIDSEIAEDIHIETIDESDAESAETPESEIESEDSEDAEVKDEPLPPTPPDLKAALIEELKFEKEDEIDTETKLESEDELDDELLSELDIDFEVDDESDDDSEDSQESKE